VGKDAWQREFLRLLDEHGPALMGMLRRLCRNAQDAEDAFQETAVRVWRAWGDRPWLRNPRGWVMTIGYRAFLSLRERREDHAELPELADLREQRPVDQASHGEECARMQTAIDALPEGVREVFVLHYAGGLTLRQVAAAMGLSTGTVKSRLSAGLRQLRSVLE
jgi:RNA polymerase sigma-70 factor (ECF subfamily)